MVAKAAWLTVQPEISLEAFLASEETDFFPPVLNCLPDDWAVGVAGPNEASSSDESD